MIRSSSCPPWPHDPTSDPTEDRRSYTTPGGTTGGSRCQGVNGDRLTTKGSLFFDKGFIAEGAIRLHGATIGGDLSLSTGEVAQTAGNAIICDAADIGHSIFFNDGFVAKGTVRLHGATIGGHLICSKGSFEPASGDALSCDSAEITGSVFLNDGFVAKGTVRLLGTTIGGSLYGAQASLEPIAGAALVCDRAEINGGVALDDGFVAKGSVRLLGAAIGGNLACSNGSFEQTDEFALACDNAEIAGNVYMDGGFVAKGTVRIPGASVGGDFTCRGGIFNGSLSIIAEKTKISGSIFLDDDFRASGVIDLMGLDVDGIVDCIATWTSGNWHLDGLTYRRFAGDSPVDAAARLRWLDCQPADHLNHDFRPQPWEQCAKVLAEMGHESDAIAIRVEKRVRMRHLPLHRVRTGRKKKRLRAAVVHLWRRPSRQAGRTVRRALVAYVLALARQARVRLGMAWDFLLCLTVGYGFRPMRALVGLLVCWAIAAIVYAYVVPRGVMAPTDPLVYLSKTIPAECRLDWVTFETTLGPEHDDARITAARASGVPYEVDPGGLALVPAWSRICPRLMPSEYTTFSPWIYALDVLLPIVDLRQEKDWSPRVTDETGATIAPWSEVSPWGWWDFVVHLLDRIPGIVAEDWGWGYVVRIFEWLLILVGWGLSALLLGAVTGVIRRD